MACGVCEAIRSGKTKLFEDEDIVAYLEEKPAALAHVIIATKRHYTEIEATPDYLVAWCFTISNKISKVLLESLNIQGLNLLVEVSESTQHFAINLLPRLQGDNLNFKWVPTKADFNGLMKVQGLYKRATGKKWIFERREGSKKPVQREDSRVESGENNYRIRQLHRLP